MAMTNETREFLESLWGLYVSDKPLYYEVFCINDDGKKIVKFFEGPNAPKEVSEWLSDNYKKLVNGRYHVYYGILPRARRPEKGRGSASDVDRGLWLWADLDYKRSYENLSDVPIPEEGKERAREVGYWFEELEDYALRGVYRSGNKWVYVERPSLSKVINEVKEKLGIEPTIVVDSGGGYHLYFKLRYELEASKLRELEELIVDVLGADKQSKDLARVLRLPGSINPRLNRAVKVILLKESEVEPEELMKLEHREAKTTLSVSEFRLLSDNELLEIKEAIKEAWVEGQRQYLALFLSGWFAKARVHPISVAKLFRVIAEERSDEELEERLSTIYYSYRKAYGTIKELEELDRVIEDWRNEGVLRRSVSRAISKELEERVKGKSGVQEILEQTVGEERALEIIRRIEDILGYASPFRDSLTIITDFDKNIGFTNNPRLLRIYRVKLDNGRIVPLKLVWEGAITSLTVYINPIGGSTKFEVRWESRVRRRPLIIPPSTISEIYEKLKSEGFLSNSRLGEDALRNIINAFISKGKAIVKEEIDTPGFYLVGNKVVAVKYELRDVAKEELREALELLNELAMKWYGHIIDKFATVIKWGIISPFIFIRKQLGRQYQVPYLILYGERDTGKTTLAEIATIYIWGLEPVTEYSIGVGKANTEARLVEQVSRDTFPRVINECNSLFYNPAIINIIKTSVESTIIRGKFKHGRWVEYPGLSPLIFTLNPNPPVDFEGLELIPKTAWLLHFTAGEVISPERKNEFNKVMTPNRLFKLRALGQYIAREIIDNGPEILKKDWIELSEELLIRAYKDVGLEVPKWVYETYKERSLEEIKEDKIERIRVKLVKYINEQYARNIRKILASYEEGLRSIDIEDVSIEQKLNVLLKNRLIPFMISRNDTVFLTRSIISELGLDIASLKSLAELLGWRYHDKKSFRFGKKVTSLSVVEVPIEELAEFLKGEVGE